MLGERMPTFFHKALLAPELQARWESAELEYRRVSELNALNHLEAERAAAGDLDPERARLILAQWSMHRPSEKSALFWRLLNGQPALPHPPPTAYSYPWYELIESAQWLSCGCHCAPAVAADPKRPERLLVYLAQSAYEVVWRNELACAWPDLGAEQKRERLRGGERPRMELRCGAWGPFELTLGRVRMEASREAMKSGGGPDFGDNPVELETVKGEPDWVRAECDGWVISRRPVERGG